MRFYIMTDIEGVSGVVDYEKDCSPEASITKSHAGAHAARASPPFKGS